MSERCNRYTLGSDRAQYARSRFNAGLSPRSRPIPRWGPSGLAIEAPWNVVLASRSCGLIRRNLSVFGCEDVYAHSLVLGWDSLPRFWCRLDDLASRRCFRSTFRGSRRDLSAGLRSDGPPTTQHNVLTDCWPCRLARIPATPRHPKRAPGSS